MVAQFFQAGAIEIHHEELGMHSVRWRRVECQPLAIVRPLWRAMTPIARHFDHLSHLGAVGFHHINGRREQVCRADGRSRDPCQGKAQRDAPMVDVANAWCREVEAGAFIGIPFEFCDFQGTLPTVSSGTASLPRQFGMAIPGRPIVIETQSRAIQHTEVPPHDFSPRTLRAQRVRRRV